MKFRAAFADPAPEMPGTQGQAPGKLDIDAGKFIVMLGTSPATRGGIAAVVSTYRDGGLFESARIRYVATHSDGSRVTKAWRFVQGFGELLMLLVLGRVAAVHAHVSSRASFWRKSILLLVCRIFGRATMFHLHSGGFAEWVGSEKKGSLRQRWIRHTLESSAVVVVLTATWARWITEFAPRANVRVLGNPVALPATELLAEQRASFSGPGRVLFLGWIYDFKGCYDLLKAWVSFREQFPGWRLAVGGKGEVDEFLVEADRLGIREDIDFLGWVAGEDKDRELRRADVFVLPSYREGMPVSILEAMAYGVAVVTTPVGGVPDMMVEGVHGLWFKPGDIAALSTRLGELAGDPSLRARLANEARSHVVRNSSVEAVLRPLTRLYAELIRGR